MKDPLIFRKKKECFSHCGLVPFPTIQTHASMSHAMSKVQALRCRVSGVVDCGMSRTARPVSEQERLRVRVGISTKEAVFVVFNPDWTGILGSDR